VKKKRMCMLNGGVLLILAGASSCSSTTPASEQPTVSVRSQCEKDVAKDYPRPPANATNERPVWDAIVDECVKRGGWGK
jgi:hypothetical protein